MHQAKRSLLNFFAVALTGCRSETVETALATLSQFSGGRQAALIGRRERIDALTAAFLNAAGANVLDFCDTHVPTAIHPTAPLAPALLALGELKRVSGRDLILAFVLGQEVECRIGLAISPSHYNRGWHITATCGVFGAAAGSGKLLGLSSVQTVWALGTAATEAAGLCECLGTPAKSVGVGNAAKNGLFAALLAAKNFSGPAEPLAGTQGYYHALNETRGLVASHRRTRRHLGDHENVVQAVSLRLRAASGARLRTRLAARSSRRRRGQGQGDRQSAARPARRPAENHRPARNRKSACSTPWPPRSLPATPAPNSSPQACVNDPAVAALRGKIEVTRDESFSTVAAAVEIATVDGKLHTLAQNAARGSDLNPMSDRDLEDKLRDAAAAWDPRHDVAPLIEAIWALDTCRGYFPTGGVHGAAGVTEPTRWGREDLPGPSGPSTA